MKLPGKNVEQEIKALAETNVWQMIRDQINFGIRHKIDTLSYFRIHTRIDINLREHIRRCFNETI
jgi:hypothetical protein